VIVCAACDATSISGGTVKKGRRLSERMMGLEPTTFCMADASERSQPFAAVRSEAYFAALSLRPANGREPERTLNLAILATTGPGDDVQMCAVSFDRSHRLYERIS
jgi:hypothetical protein